ncbi:MAG: hypothetical protein HQM16_17555, partial [Deltaproteobacteria bacterium]|nr:hypothetical protein [Deltaproteobacteria bacterium]
MTNTTLVATALPKILLVDDTSVNLKFMKAVLKDSGADIFLASSGPEAIELCAQH